MEFLALLCKSPKRAEAVKDSLKNYTVHAIRDLTELEESLINYTFDLCIVDSDSFETSQINTVIRLFGRESIVLLTHPEFDAQRLESLPLQIKADNMHLELQPILELLLNKKNTRNQNNAILHREPASRTPEKPPGAFAKRDLPGSDFLYRHVLVNFAKVLTAHFDIDKLLSHFMESLAEIAKVNKISIMLREKNVFVIKAQKGLDPYLARELKLDLKSTLVYHLAQHGGIIQRTATAENVDRMRIFQEMGRLQCILSFPMIYKGRLEGIVNIGEKITGEPFYNDELEVIYTLCNYQSAAIKDIDLYHQIQSQKDFIRNILSNMNSGVITIDKDETIRVFNPKASEILGIGFEDIIGKDLRNLPSPLGDILYETMVDGIFYERHEALLRPRRIQLGINSYRLDDERGNVAGAGIIFSDISDLKRFEEEKRRAEKLRMMHLITGQIAHSIKNPLSSIMTFTQLLEEKFEDMEFRQFYKTTVLQSVDRLNKLINKILFLSDSLEFAAEAQDVNVIIEEVGEAVNQELPEGVNLVVNKLEKPAFINADRPLLSKGLYYLIVSCAERLQKGDSIILEANTIGNKISHIEIAVTCPDTRFIEGPVGSALTFSSEAPSEDLDVALIQKIAEGHKGSLMIKQVNAGSSVVISIPACDIAG